MTPSQVSAAQRERANPRLSTMERIAVAGFGMSLAEFMAGPPDAPSEYGTARLHAETHDRRQMPAAPLVPASDTDGAHLPVSQRAAQGFEHDLVSIRDITAALQSVVRQLVSELEAGRQATAPRARSSRRARTHRKSR